MVVIFIVLSCILRMYFWDDVSFYINCMVFLHKRDSKEELHLKPKLSTFFAISQNHQHFFEK